MTLTNGYRRAEFTKLVAQDAQSLRVEADGTVLRGLIALEQGDVDTADVAFRTALSVWKDDDAAASGAGLDFHGRVIAKAARSGWISRGILRQPRRSCRGEFGFSSRLSGSKSGPASIQELKQRIQVGHAGSSHD